MDLSTKCRLLAERTPLSVRVPKPLIDLIDKEVKEKKSTRTKIVEFIFTEYFKQRVKEATNDITNSKNRRSKKSP